MTQWLVLVLAATSSAAAADVEWGGVRPVRGSVIVANRAYEVTVAFAPVRAFDPVTNDEVNRELAREYALRVLALHLSKEHDVEFAAGGETLIAAGPDGQRYRAVVRWPQDRVSILREAKATAVVRRVSAALLTDGFFTTRRDYLDTVAGLQAAQSAGVRAAEASGRAAPVAQRRRVLARAVADAEERGAAAREALARAVRADPRLLATTERPELLAALAAAGDDHVRALRAVLAAVPGSGERLAYTDVRIDPAFEPYLTASPLVMELGGAVVADVGTGERVILGVAKTVLERGDAADLVRAERVCTLKARAAVVADREGVTVSYLKKVADRVSVVADGTGERAVTASDRLMQVREQTAGLAKGLTLVGRWRSEDGRVFYLAVGGRFDQAGEPIRP